MVVHIKINKLSLEFMREEITGKVDNTFAIILKIDLHAYKQTKGIFARICMKINLGKSLQTCVQIEDQWFNFEYEEINLVL